MPTQRAGATLRSTLWQIRRRAPGVLTVDAQNVRLTSSVLLDYTAAIAASRALDRDEELPATDFEPLRHDLLVDWQDEWVLLERERFRQIRLHALENRCQRMVRAGDTATAIDIGLGAVAVDPLRETAQRALIQAHLADGNLSEAVRTYSNFAALLRSELGVEPSKELAALLPQTRCQGRRTDAPRTAFDAASGRSRGRG